MIQLTFVPYFISADVAAWGQALQDERARLGLPAVPWSRPRAPRPGEDPARVAEEHAETFGAVLGDRLKSWLDAHPRPR